MREQSSLDQTVNAALDLRDVWAPEDNRLLPPTRVVMNLVVPLAEVRNSDMRLWGTNAQPMMRSRIRHRGVVFGGKPLDQGNHRLYDDCIAVKAHRTTVRQL